MRVARPRLQFAQWVVLAPFGVFCFVYPFALLLLSLDWMPFGMEWMSSLLLAMLGLTAVGWLWLNFGARGVGLGAVIFLLGVGLEYVGVNTGAPFGRYRYTGVLIPGLPGGVPLAIGFAWVLIIVGSVFTARWVLRERPARGRPAAEAAGNEYKEVLLGQGLRGLGVYLVGAGLAVGLDLLLEPVAYHVKGYWEWLGEGGGYYGVPWVNFAAWLVAALVMGGLAGAILGRRQTLRWGWVPVALYAMNVLLFGVVNVAHGFWAAGVIGLGLLAVLYLVS